MSRLDDELKLLFQRHEPSEDFAQRVLARINVGPKPKASFWRTLALFFQPLAFRWAVAAAAILLVAIMGFVQYQRLHKNAADSQQADVPQVKSNDNAVVHDSTTPQENQNQGGITEKASDDHNQPDVRLVHHETLKPRHQQRLKYVKHPSVKNEDRIASQRKSEGEIAKEQLMKALFIASATVNEAKKLAMGDE